MTTFQASVRCVAPGALGNYVGTLREGQRQAGYVLTSEVEDGVVEVYNWSKLVHMAGLKSSNEWNTAGGFNIGWVVKDDIPEVAKVQCRKLIKEYTET